MRINAGGKTKWQEDELEKTYRYDLKFYKIRADQPLPDENRRIGDDWIMKLLDDSLDTEDVWIPHRVCGDVIIGVLAPENYEFSIDKLGDRIPHFETPNLSLILSSALDQLVKPPLSDCFSFSGSLVVRSGEMIVQVSPLSIDLCTN